MDTEVIYTRDLRIVFFSFESNLESDVRFEIESNHEASQVPNLYLLYPYRSFVTQSLTSQISSRIERLVLDCW